VFLLVSFYFPSLFFHWFLYTNLNYRSALHFHTRSLFFDGKNTLTHLFIKQHQHEHLNPYTFLHMHTHGFSCLRAYIYIFYTSTIFVHFYHENTAPLHLTHSHIQHLALKYPPGHTHTSHTDSTACMTAHPFFFVSSVSSQHAQHTHTFLCFCFSTIYISTTHIYNHSHFTRSVLSKQVRFVSQHKHIIFLVLFYIFTHISLPVLLCTYTYIYIQQIMLIIPPSKHLSTYIHIMLFFYL
jgi:hypothetical protein